LLYFTLKKKEKNQNKTTKKPTKNPKQPKNLNQPKNIQNLYKYMELKTESSCCIPQGVCRNSSSLESNNTFITPLKRDVS